MPHYIYKAKKGPKDVISGKITAESKDVVINKLISEGYFPISVEEEGEKKAPALSKKIRISTKDLGVFTRQLADLLEGGLTLFQSLDILSKQTQNKVFSRIIEDLRDEIREGNTLSDAMQRYPKTFSQLYISMIKSGEAGGMLETVLVRLSEFSEKETELRSRIRNAMVYPFFLGSFGIMTIGVLLVFVVPKLSRVFLDFGQSLPLPTLILINTSGFIQKWWWLILFIIFIIYFLFRRQNSTIEGRLVFDKWKLKMPVLGNLILVGELSRFSRTLSTLLESGVPVLKSLDIVNQTINNAAVKTDLQKVYVSISKGGSLGNSLEESPYFPLMMTNMIKVGEKSGVIEKSLIKVANTYDREIDKVTKLFTILLEPVLILSMGLVVGVIVISMLLPIFSINLAVK